MATVSDLGGVDMRDAKRAITIGLWFLMTIVPVRSLAYAQIDLSGEWATTYHEDPLDRTGGPQVGEYMGLPINDAARMRADSWDAELLALREHQCIPHPADYGNSFSNLRIWKEVDLDTQQMVAYHTLMQWMTTPRTIYMDGRPHPPEYAAHTWQGFSTGQWDGNILTVTTTHMKAGWFRRNGVPRSPSATLREHFVRHGDVLTWVTVVDDPAYLEEPFIRSRGFVLEPNQSQISPYPCDYVEEVSTPAGWVPHHLPGTNTQLREFSDEFGLPLEGVRGGAETLYPEYRLRIREQLRDTNPRPGEED